MNSFLTSLQNPRFLYWFFSIAILFNLAFNASFITAPLIGQNSWRDAQTFSVARNFVEEGRPITEPAYDIRHTNEGRLPGEFPLQSYYCSVFLKFISISTTPARLSTFLAFVLSAALVYFISLKKWGQHTALFATATFVSHPLVSVQSIGIMPETMVNLWAWAALFCYFYVDSSVLKWTFVTLCITACTLIKPSGFVVVAFLIPYDFIQRKDLKNWHFYLLTILVPVVLLLVWIHHTLQFERLYYGHPLTHEYHHHIAKAWRELTLETSASAFEKTFRHAFNISCLVGLVMGIYTVIKKKLYTWITVDAWFLASITYLGGGIFFLLYASGIQHNQLYYATPLTVPAFLLLMFGYHNSSGHVKLLLTLLVLLQTNIKANTMFSNFSEKRSSWVDYRLEKVTDKFSKREDPFIIYPFTFSDFTQLGRIGRRGMNFSNTFEMDSMATSFEYLCLIDTTRKQEILKYVEPTPILTHPKATFYVIKK